MDLQGYMRELPAANRKLTQDLSIALIAVFRWLQIISCVANKSNKS